MVPHPPQDAALPGLGTALDGGAVANLLTGNLPADQASKVGILACRPSYIRYKPGTNATILYDVRLRDRDSGEVFEAPIHLRLFADDRARRLWAKPQLHALVERAGRWHHAPWAGSAVPIPELAALAQVYPLDLDLPALVDAASPVVMDQRLRATRPRGAEPERTLAAAELVRYKPGRKALLRYRLGDDPRGAAFAKLHTDGRGGWIRDLTLALSRDGLPTPLPLAYLDDLHLLVHAATPGTPLWSLRGEPAFAAAMDPFAAALSDLHASTHPGLPLATVATFADATAATATAIEIVHPPVVRRVRRLAEEIARGLGGIAPVTATVHGDCSPDQVLVDGTGITLIDFERAGLGHPLLDVGTFLAHLTADVAKNGCAGVEDARGAFLEAYGKRRPVTEADVRLIEAGALLGLAIGPFRRLEQDWPETVERLVDLAEERFRASGPRHAPAADLSQTTDPALPQLARLLDPAVMAARLEEVLGWRPKVCEVNLVRHKPGRRAILRYGLQGSPHRPGVERVYGKTFASERGPRVCEITRAVVAARACGPDVRLPDVVGYLPDLKLLVQREVPGEPVGRVLLHGDELLVRHIADALHAFHTSGLDLGRRHDPAKELDPLLGRVEGLGAACPSLDAAARRCLATVQAGREAFDWRWRPVHRDFYHDQVLVGSDGLAVIDVDDAAMSEPAVDVANFAAHLRLLALQELGDSSGLAGVRAAFVDRSLGLDPDLDRGLLRFLEGATLLRLAAIHQPRDRGEWLAGRLLVEAEELLARPVEG